MPEVPTQNSPVRRFLLYHLPAIAYAAAIVAVSSIPDLKGPQFRFLFFDKLVHFVEYAVFAILTFRSLSHLTSTRTRGRAFLLSALFLSLFASFDELYQHFVPGRDSDVYDLAVDIAGALLVLAYLRIRPPRTKREAARL